jgi:hypothetical protein
VVVRRLIRRALGLHLQVLQQLVLPVAVALVTQEIRVTAAGRGLRVREVRAGRLSCTTIFRASVRRAHPHTRVNSAAITAATAAAEDVLAVLQAIPELPALPAMLPQHSTEPFPVGRLETGELEETRAPLAVPAVAAGVRTGTAGPACPGHLQRSLAQAAAEEVVVRLVVRAIPAAPALAAAAVPEPISPAPAAPAAPTLKGAFLEEEAEVAVERATAAIRAVLAIPEAPALLLTTQKQ